MRGTLGRIRDDLSHRRNVEGYTVAASALACSLLSICGDLVPDGLRWGVLSSGIALLVARTALADDHRPADDLLGDRHAFDDQPLPARLRGAREVWLFAPSGKNFLTSPNCEILRRHILAREDGTVRVVLLEETDAAAVRLATRQLTEATDFPGQSFPDSLVVAANQLRTIAGWPMAGTFGYRTFGFNPGFSILALNPTAADGVVIVEFHGVHNVSTAGRMHLRLTRREQPKWFEYWCDQFTHIWTTARPRQFGPNPRVAPRGNSPVNSMD